MVEGGERERAKGGHRKKLGEQLIGEGRGSQVTVLIFTGGSRLPPPPIPTRHHLQLGARIHPAVGHRAPSVNCQAAWVTVHRTHIAYRLILRWLHPDTGMRRSLLCCRCSPALSQSPGPPPRLTHLLRAHPSSWSSPVLPSLSNPWFKNSH